MKCPVCESVDLTMADRQGVEIDYCSKCRGVWLDRGELDKIIDRTSSVAPPPSPGYDSGHRSDRQASHDPRSQAYKGQGYGDNGYYKGKKKKSLLSELFDF